jgi:WD40 repeat protein
LAKTLEQQAQPPTERISAGFYWKILAIAHSVEVSSAVVVEPGVSEIGHLVNPGYRPRDWGIAVNYRRLRPTVVGDNIMSARTLSRRIAVGVVLLLAFLARPPQTHCQEVATLKPEGTLPQTDCVAFSPDGKSVVMGSFFNTVVVWDVEKKMERYSLAGNTAAVTAVAFSPEGNRLTSASNDNTVKVWDAMLLEK